MSDYLGRIRQRDELMTDRVLRAMLLAAVMVLASEVKRLRVQVDRLCVPSVSNADRDRNSHQPYTPSLHWSKQ
ncbi:hypothetical protein [Nocardia sp. NPDC057030]|uniref:hypothetical protein n=1 Tax=unclassified Nocardia TaxID=2637762 RepID=UPI00362830E7